MAKEKLMKIFNVYTWTKIIDWPMDFYRDVKWFIQRGRRGYSDRDRWDIDFYLTSIIVPMVKNLKENHSSVPTWTKEKSEEEAEKEWNDILDDIIFAWETNNKILETDWIYVTKNNRKRLENAFKNRKDMHVMTKEECERYRKGMRLFTKHLNGLWD